MHAFCRFYLNVSLGVSADSQKIYSVNTLVALGTDSSGGITEKTLFSEFKEVLIDVFLFKNGAIIWEVMMP